MNKRQAAQLTACVSAGLSLLVWIAVAVLFFTRPSATDGVAANPEHLPWPSAPDIIAGSPSQGASTAASVNDDRPADSPAPINVVGSVLSPPPTSRARDLVLEEKFPYLELPAGLLNSAFDPVTSDILLVGAHQKQVAIYGADQIGYRDARPTLIPLDGKPTAIGVKLLDDRRFYLVATIDPTLLVMIDADSREIVRQVSLRLPQLKIWDNLNKDDPSIVMAPFNETDLFDYSRRDGQVNEFKYWGAANAVQYDLRAMTEGPALQGKIVDVASQGPKKKVLFMPLESSYTSLNLAEVSSGDRLIVQSTRKPWSRNLLPRILGDVIAMGQRVTTHDLNEEVGIAEFYPKAQMANTDFIAGNYERTVRIASTSPLESVFEFDLPKEWEIREDPADTSPKHRETVMFADTRAMQFLVVLPKKLLAIPLAKAGIEQRASLQLALDGETTVFAERKLELNVLGRPDIKQLSLVSAPDGMTLEDNKLIWTPSNAQSGIHTCTLSSSFALFDSYPASVAR